ncbi:MAG: GNAT family N-acetyltransferase [Cupriavidus sp.]|uniref:GNAT family N-acetyltransferase n=1 Tax=Cupriavidus pauculus TaxID=82633 RepID=UPI000C465442|nr:GNAT family N-acetyltransferase [Cupriavidus pauculus]KAB0602586.1 GNAT family N-acetyltransferase [Cupriavidus pauculus]MBU64461.1 GNAT family N-acetyltransferase [Cupriavidus sp.]MCM3604280.1 GNAT family N-acetyltransferase [Cupriavidus pauculus]UAK98325.1 GNAT family N-acetyltransferase [Cupriavidus pauculus]
MQPLRGTHFQLRPFRVSDEAQLVMAVRESMSTVGLWMPWARADYSVFDAQEWFARCAAAMEEGTAYDIGVFSPDGRDLYGSVAINQIRREDNLGNLGYWIRESRQHRGLASGAAAMMACHGFHALGLTRLEIVAVETNHASRAVAEKIGAEFECIARNRLILRGRPVAAAVYSLVPESFSVPS